MAKVQVPAHWVAANYLPPICARHGGPSTSVVKRKFSTRPPGWSYVLILVGVLIFAIVAMALQFSVRTSLPACAECSRDRRRFIGLALSGWVAAIILTVVASTATTSAALVVLGLLALACALVFSFVGDSFRVSGHVTADRAWVNLKGVHATFAAAINNALRPASPVLATTEPAAPVAAYQGTPNILPGQ
jgi:hypothetical protein